MLTELRAKSAITIPKNIVTKLGLKIGDKLEIYEKDGVICILPVVVYSKNYITELYDEIENVKTKINNDKQFFLDADTMFIELEK